jgi:hypothetical protein
MSFRIHSGISLGRSHVDRALSSGYHEHEYFRKPDGAGFETKKDFPTNAFVYEKCTIPV